MLNRERNAASGLSLVEFTTALGTLAILFGLTLSSHRSVLSSIKKFQCRENLRQWGLATQYYALDNNDFLPKDGAPNGRSRKSGWYINLPLQLGVQNYHSKVWKTNSVITLPRSIWLCPANRRKSNGLNLFHYCLNQHVNGIGTGKQVQLSSLSTPTKLVWLFDNGRFAAVAQQNNTHTNLHQKGANFLFVDGRVSHYLSPEYWNYQTRRGRTNNSDLSWHPNRN